MRYFYIFFLCQNIVLGQFVGLRDEIENADEKNIDDLIPNKKEPSTGSAYDADQSEPGNEAYVEVLIVVDKKLSEMVSDAYSYGIWNRNKSISWLNAGNKIQDRILYFKKFISAVNFRFQTNFVNPSIQLTISGFLHGNPSFVTPPKDDENAINSVTTLHHMSFVFGFAKFRKDHNFDIVLFLTEKKICKYETCKGYQKLTGTSYTEGACMDIKATEQGLTHGVAIVQDFGAFSGVDTAAREIGRLLGAKDDGDNNPCSSDDGYIMSNLRTKKTLSKGNAYKFSKCSVKSIQIFLKTPQAKSCLFTDPQLFSSYRTLPWRELVAPHVPSLGDQCSVSKTPEGISAFPSLCGENPCQVLECVSGTDCLAFLPAIDGSRCNNQGSVCYQGECVQKDTSTSEDQWWAGKCLIKGAGKFLPIGAYVNAWDCLDRCQSAQIEGKPDYYTACEYSRAKGECQVYTGQIEHPVGEFTWSSKSMCYIFKKGGSSGGSDTRKFPGYCLDSTGKDQNGGEIPLAKKYATSGDCLRACNDPSGPFYKEVTGCEHNKSKKSCLIHTREVVSGGGSFEFTCFVLKKKGKPTDDTARKFAGHCSDSNGNDQNTGAISLNQTYATAEDCLRACRNSWTYKEKTGCEYYPTGKSCRVHTGEVTSGCGSPAYICYVLGVVTATTTMKTTTTRKPTTKKPVKLLRDCPYGWLTYAKHCYKFIMGDEPADVNMDKTLQRCVNLVSEEANIVQIDSFKQQTWIERQIKATKEKSKSMRNQETFFIQKPYDLETNKTRYNNLNSARRTGKYHAGKCLDKNGKKKDNRRIEFGVQKTVTDCVRSCNQFVPTFGCEYKEISKKCSGFYSNVLSGDGSQNYLCWIFDSQKEEKTQNRNVHLAQTLGNFSINDNENICLSAIYSQQTGYATWHYAFCSEPFDNIMCMFKQRKPNDICKKIEYALTDPWQNDPKSPDNTGSFVCTAEKSLQLFCKDSKQYCSMQRLPQQYVYATECANLCKLFRKKNEHKQCLYYIFNEAERVCTLMIACEQQFKISICEDTSAKNYTSGKCHQTGNDYTHPTIFNVKNDLDECKGIGRPVGKWTRGACRGSGGRGIFKGLVELGIYSNQHNCLERCNLEAHVTGCEWRKQSGYECKAHTEKVIHGSGAEDDTYCFVYKQYNENN